MVSLPPLCADIELQASPKKCKICKMLAAGQAGGNIPIPWEVQRDFLLQGQHTALTLTLVLAW